MKKGLILFILLSAAVPLFVFSEEIGQDNPLKDQRAEDLWRAISSTVFLLSLVVSVVLAGIGSINIATAAGDVDKSSRARKKILYAAIILAVGILFRGSFSFLYAILGW